MCIRDSFYDTFELLNRTLNEDTFKRYNGHRHLGAFSISGFEFIACGVAKNIDKWRDHQDDLKERLRSAWTAPDFKANSGAGVSPRQRMPRFAIYGPKFFGE